MRIQDGVMPEYEIRRDLKSFIHSGEHVVGLDNIANGVRCEVIDDKNPKKPYGDKNYDRYIMIAFTIDGKPLQYGMRSWEIVQI